MFTQSNKRLRKTFQNQELALVQERQWRTDYERGLLLPDTKPLEMTFEQVAHEWWEMAVGQNRIRNPQISEKSRVKMLLSFFGRRPVSGLQFIDGERWINERLKNKRAIGTINRDMKPLKWIMNYAVKKGYIKESPFRELKDLKGANIRVRWMTQEEVNLLVDSVHKLGDRTLLDVIEVGLNTGFRKGNLERLTARDISNNRITASKTKSGKPYDVPVSPAVVSTLERLLRERPTGALLDTKKLDGRFRKAVKLARLYTTKGNPENVTIHTLRHTFSALYLKRGGDIYKLSKLLGHASVSITEKVYGHICPRELDAQAPLMSTAIRPHRESNPSFQVENLAS